MVDLVSAVLAESGADLADYNLSANHLNTKKNKQVVEYAEEKKENYNPPEFPIYAWDEKHLERHGIVENRLAVSICGDERDPQHIGSCLLEDGKGVTTAKEIATQSAKWGVGKDGKLPVMSLYDTTSANSGSVIRVHSRCIGKTAVSQRQREYPLNKQISNHVLTRKYS